MSTSTQQPVVAKDRAPMNLQHVNVKLMVENGAAIDLQPLIPIFNNWIKDHVFEELLLDVADYRHIPEGPGVMIIGYQADYSVDNTDDRLGVRYNRKTPLDGTNDQRLRQAARAALLACQRLESEPALQGQLRFNGRDVELFFNDRLLVPNTDATREAIRPELKTFFDKLFRGVDYSVSHAADRRRLFGVTARAAQPVPVATLLANLDS
jgi:hypothetical protein